MILGDDFFKELLHNLHDGVCFVDQERRITYWNKGAERISGISPDEVLGMRCFDNILKHVDEEGCQMCTGECPLAATLTDGNPHESDTFLQHKAGHRIPVSVRVSPIQDEDGRVVGAVEIFSDNPSKTAALEREGLLIDPVTGVGNRRHVEVRLRASLDAFRRYGWPFGVLLVDLDHFRNVNETYGHDTGDKVLYMVAQTLAGNLRSVDTFGRWDGAEFVALVTNPSGEHLRMIAERGRRLVTQSAMEAGLHLVRVTISIGATMVRAEDTVESLLARADRLRYIAKASGRNRVEFEEPRGGI